MNDLILTRHAFYEGVPGPLLLVILDGVGLYRGRDEGYAGNAFDLAQTPNLDRLFERAAVFRTLKAHGTAVGLPSDGDMGNSEVGHNAMGAGLVFAQGARLVNEAIKSGSLYRSEAWRQLLGQVVRRGSSLHFIGLLSDGNVHSHINHLEALMRRATAEGAGRIRVHALADGRDVHPRTFHLYLERLEAVLGELRGRGCDAAVASGGGRMRITMDRYNADWDMVRQGWETHVLGRGRVFRSAQEAVAALRAENPGVIDQDLPPFVVGDEESRPIGSIEDGDAVVFFNYRGDRAIEISRAFTEIQFDKFDRVRTPSVVYAGMMQYDGDLLIPPAYLVEPPAISSTVSEYLARTGVRQLATAETQKFGHVTYFWNGNNSEKFDEELEDWVEVPSDRVPFETAPEMKAHEVCGVVLEALERGAHRFLRVNFANGDMVGHTGVLEAAVRAMETVDQCVGRLERAIERCAGTMIVTADHGNLEQMWEVSSSTGEVKRDAEGVPVSKTSHTLCPVPWLVVGRDSDRFEANPDVLDAGLGHLAATLLLLLGFAAPEKYLPPLIRLARGAHEP